MKRLLLLFGLLVVPTITIAQNKTDSYLTNAKKFLKDDVCNNTGIEWVKSALDVDPNNDEAQKLFKECNDTKYKDAINLAETNINDNSAIAKLVQLAKLEDYNTELANFLIAKNHIERGLYGTAKEYINKAIELNNNNLEYRWLRVRCNSLSSSVDKDFILAISDLNFLIDNNGSSAKVYALLGRLETELASYIFRFRKASKNESFNDDNSEYIKKQTEIYKEVIVHYIKSKEAYSKAIEMNYSESDLSYRLKEKDKNIADVNKEIENLK